MTDKQTADAGKIERGNKNENDLFKIKPVSQPETPVTQLTDDDLESISGGRRASCGAGDPGEKKGG